MCVYITYKLSIYDNQGKQDLYKKRPHETLIQFFYVGQTNGQMCIYCGNVCVKCTSYCFITSPRKSDDSFLCTSMTKKKSIVWNVRTHCNKKYLYIRPTRLSYLTRDTSSFIILEIVIYWDLHEYIVKHWSLTNFLDKAKISCNLMHYHISPL